MNRTRCKYLISTCITLKLRKRLNEIYNLLIARNISKYLSMLTISLLNSARYKRVIYYLYYRNRKNDLSLIAQNDEKFRGNSRFLSYFPDARDHLSSSIIYIDAHVALARVDILRSHCGRSSRSGYDRMDRARWLFSVPGNQRP